MWKPRLLIWPVIVAAGRTGINTEDSEIAHSTQPDYIKFHCPLTVDAADGTAGDALKPRLASSGFVIERVPTTGQQREKAEDGLRLVFELLGRRYRLKHRRDRSCELPPDSP